MKGGESHASKKTQSSSKKSSAKAQSSKEASKAQSSKEEEITDFFLQAEKQTIPLHVNTGLFVFVIFSTIVHA